jgi:hypothetical protein
MSGDFSKRLGLFGFFSALEAPLHPKSGQFNPKFNKIIFQYS